MQALRPGTAVVSASVGMLSEEIDVFVNLGFSILSLRALPEEQVTLTQGTCVELVAEAVDSAGATRDVTAFTLWTITSGTSMTQTIAGAERFCATGNGTTVITASLTGQEATVRLGGTSGYTVTSSGNSPPQNILVHHQAAPYTIATFGNSHDNGILVHRQAAPYTIAVWGPEPILNRIRVTRSN